MLGVHEEGTRVSPMSQEWARKLALEAQSFTLALELDHMPPAGSPSPERDRNGRITTLSLSWDPVKSVLFCFVLPTPTL